MYKANVKFGSVPVQVEAATLKDLIKQTSFFAELPTECSCGSHNLVPKHRQHEDNDFYEVLCADCGQTMGIGQHKKGDTLFVKQSDGWREPFRRQAQD